MIRLFTLMTFLIIMSNELRAQEKIVDLQVDSSLTGKISKVPFNAVEVLDHRFDTTKIGMAQTGMFNKLKPARFTEPASLAIQNYITTLVGQASTESRRLVVNLKKLQTLEKTFAMSERGYVYFSAEAYLQLRDNDFVKVYSLDSLFILKGLDVTKAVFKKIPFIIDDMIMEVSKIEADKIPQEGIVSYNELLLNVRNEWALYPINNNPPAIKGIYRTFSDFRNNVIDTTVEVSFSQNGNSIKVDIIDQGISQKDNAKAKKIWGVFDGEQLYIRINQSYFPLEARNNTFYFIAAIKDFPKQTIPKDSDFIITGLSSDYYYGTLAGLFQTAMVNRKSEFYLEMDTGKIVELRTIR